MKQTETQIEMKGEGEFAHLPAKEREAAERIEREVEGCTEPIDDDVRTLLRHLAQRPDAARCPTCGYRPDAIPGPSDAYAQANCPDGPHLAQRPGCQCHHCVKDGPHMSGCAVHNGPALPVGACDCGKAQLPAMPEEVATALEAIPYDWARKPLAEYLDALTAENAALKAKRPAMPECCSPSAPIVPCANCGRQVHTCEQSDDEGSSPCPAHTDGAERSDGGWTCSLFCDERIDAFDVQAAQLAELEALRNIPGHRIALAEQIKKLTTQLAERDAKVRELEARLAKTAELQRFKWNDDEIARQIARAESAEAELASIKNKLACALCLNRGTRKNPCPHKNECGYGTGEGVGQKDNNFWVSAVEFDEDCEEVAS